MKNIKNKLDKFLWAGLSANMQANKIKQQFNGLLYIFGSKKINMKNYNKNTDRITINKKNIQMYILYLQGFFIFIYIVD